MFLRGFASIFFISCLLSIASAQNADSLRRTSKRISVDTHNMQDTTNLPTDKDLKKKARKAKTKEAKKEKEKAKEEPVIYKDSTRLALEARTRKAVRSSAVLPGLGQIQNGRWWKVPFVYGGFVGLGLFFDFNQRNYHFFLEEVQFRLANPNQFLHEEYAAYNNESIIQAKDFYRRNRDLSVLLALGWYGIQLIDAYVDAKFFRYDIDDDLSFKINPFIERNPTAFAYNQPVFGLKVTFQLR